MPDTLYKILQQHIDVKGHLRASMNKRKLYVSQQIQAPINKSQNSLHF